MTNWTHVDYIRWQAPKGAKATDYPVELRLLQLDENGARIASGTLYGCYACGNVYETADAAKGCGHGATVDLRIKFSGNRMMIGVEAADRLPAPPVDGDVMQFTDFVDYYSKETAHIPGGVIPINKTILDKPEPRGWFRRLLDWLSA